MALLSVGSSKLTPKGVLQLKGGPNLKTHVTLLAGLLLFLMIASVSAQTTKVPFNGNFSAGSTLFSDTINVKDSSLYGRDVYPIKENKVCTSYNVTRHKAVCERINGKRVCHREEIVMERQRCIRVTNTPIGCQNPTTGFTNQLNLENFKMSINGGSYQSVPYGMNQIWINNANIKFKVVIPNNCNPSYNINEAIYLVK